MKITVDIGITRAGRSETIVVHVQSALVMRRDIKY
jgi:hypothetical protein